MDEEEGEEGREEGAGGVDRKEVEVGVREQRGARSWERRDGRRRVTKIRVWLARLGKATHPKPFSVLPATQHWRLCHHTTEILQSHKKPQLIYCDLLKGRE